MLRFLSKRFRRKPPAHQKSSENPRLVPYRIVLLDGTDVAIELDKKSLGGDLFDNICYTSDLGTGERCYFGLQFTDAGHISHWLDPTKRVKKQVSIGPPYTLHLRVKFYPSEPTKIRDEWAQYLIFLQLKEDLLLGKLSCSADTACFLAACTLQSDIGDFDENEEGVVSEFRFFPNQTEENENSIYLQWQELKGLVPEKAERKFLERARKIEMYGVDTHEVEGRDGNTYRLGLTPFGVLVFDNDERIGLFLWARMERISLKRRKLIIAVVENDEDTQTDKEHVFVFRVHSAKACKHVWKCAVEYHMFYRLTTVTANAKRVQSFIRMGSRFRYSAWSIDKETQLIKLIEERPCLWNANLESYANTELKATAREEIANILQYPVAEIIAKFNRLKTQFFQEVRKTEEVRSGKGAEKVYQSKWKHFQSLSFMTSQNVEQCQASPGSSILHVLNNSDDEPGCETNEQSTFPEPSSPEKSRTNLDDELLETAKKLSTKDIGHSSISTTEYSNFVDKELKLLPQHLRQRAQQEIKAILLHFSEQACAESSGRSMIIPEQVDGLEAHHMTPDVKSSSSTMHTKFS